VANAQLSLQSAAIAKSSRRTLRLPLWRSRQSCSHRRSNHAFSR